MTAFKISTAGKVLKSNVLDTKVNKNNVSEMQEMGGSMVWGPHGKLGVIQANERHDGH